MRFGPDGLLYISIGANCDVCLESKTWGGLLYTTIHTITARPADGGYKLRGAGARARRAALARALGATRPRGAAARHALEGPGRDQG